MKLCIKLSKVTSSSKWLPNNRSKYTLTTASNPWLKSNSQSFTLKSSNAFKVMWLNQNTKAPLDWRWNVIRQSVWVLRTSSTRNHQSENVRSATVWPRTYPWIRSLRSSNFHQPSYCLSICWMKKSRCDFPRLGILYQWRFRFRNFCTKKRPWSKIHQAAATKKSISFMLGSS